MKLSRAHILILTVFVCHMTGQRRESSVGILSAADSSATYPSVTTVHLTSKSQPPGVNVSGLCASWSMERDKQVLTDISFQVDQVTYECVCVYGFVYIYRILQNLCNKYELPKS